MKFIRFSNGQYYSENNEWMIQKNCFDTWDIYRAFKPFHGEYKFTCRTLKEAKKNIESRCKNDFTF